MQKEEYFTSRWGLILATLGIAVGTGNIWRFSRIVAQNGGGSFLIPWMIFLFVWSLPLIIAEFAIGKYARKGPVGAIAKIAGITLCKAYNRQHDTRFLAVMPTNLYGEHDNFHLETSHVIPAMIRKYHLAKMADQGNLAAILADERVFGRIPDIIAENIGLSPDRTALVTGKSPQVVLWGTGSPYREFLHVQDMASACIHLITTQTMSSAPVKELPVINVGTGQDQTIAETAGKIEKIVGFTGKTIFDATFPDGTPKKLLDTSRINKLGWKPAISLTRGLQTTYQWYRQQITG